MDFIIDESDVIEQNLLLFNCRITRTWLSSTIDFIDESYLLIILSCIMLGFAWSCIWIQEIFLYTFTPWYSAILFNALFVNMGQAFAKYILMCFSFFVFVKCLISSIYIVSQQFNNLKLLLKWFPNMISSCFKRLNLYLFYLPKVRFKLGGF